MVTSVVGTERRPIRRDQEGRRWNAALHLSAGPRDRWPTPTELERRSTEPSASLSDPEGLGPLLSRR